MQIGPSDLHAKRGAADYSRCPTRNSMDELTAIAFAREAFENAHPLSRRPEWLWKFATAIALRDEERNYKVFFCWKPKLINQPEDFFAVHVNASTAETTILFDTPLDKYKQDELEEYL